MVTGGPPQAEPVVPIRLAFALGPTFASLSGKNNVSAPVLFGLQLGASYDFLHGPSALRAGVKMLYASLPYTNIDAPMTSSRHRSGARLVTVDYAYRVIEQLSLGGGLGGGVIWWAGLAGGQPLHRRQRRHLRRHPDAHLRALAPRRLPLTSHFFATLNPGLLYSKTTSDGLTMGTSSMTRFDLDFGAGYRF